jgi:hypothetical protein
LNRWQEPQPFVLNPFDKSAAPVAQDIRQVWFAGVHADIGGGYPEEKSGLAKFPLEWMIREAVPHGLQIKPAMRNHLVLGRPRAGAKSVFVKPDATACLHNSMTWGWRLLEWLPKVRWNAGPNRRFAGLYMPRAEQRVIADPNRRPVIHESVIDRMNQTDYRPKNLPGDYEIEH